MRSLRKSYNTGDFTGSILMWRAVLNYGLAAGGIVAALMLVGYLFAEPASPGVVSQVLGFISMAIALSLVPLGIKHVRDRLPEGTISFFPAALVGFGIVVIASVIYSVAWEIYLFATDYQFAHNYAAVQLDEARAAGASVEQIAEIARSTQSMIELYENPILRFGLTFMELFVVGAAIALVSAAVFRNPNVLRKKKE